jgi:hypothetical protein
MNTFAFYFTTGKAHGWQLSFVVSEILPRKRFQIKNEK